MISGVVEVYRRRPGTLFGWALAVVRPRSVPRYLAIDARVIAVALGLTLVGHLTLAAIYWRHRQRRGRAPADRRRSSVAGRALELTAVQIPLGLAVEAVIGRSAFGITVGGLLPSLLLAPAWALLVAGWLLTRRARPAPARPAAR